MNGIWSRIDRYFNKNEAWGEPEKISGLLLMVLYQIRICSGWPMIIHCGTQGNHVKDSYHYKGLAVDFHFAISNGITLHDEVERLFKFFDEMQLSDSIGLGFYPEWNNPGFHFDVRGYRARWSQINGIYVSIEKGIESIK